MSAGLPAKALAALALLGALALGSAPAARASFGLSSPDAFFEAAGGEADTLAGSHPFALTTSFKLNTTVSEGAETPEGSLKDLEVQLPEGMAGIPTAVPQCSGADFATLNEETEPPKPSCSNDSAVGYVSLVAAFNPYPVGGLEQSGAPLYNLAPPPGTVAKLGFIYAKVPVTIEVKLSEEAPYRVVAILRHAAQPLLLYGSKVTVWGDPAAASHDPYRGECLEGIDAEGNPVSSGSCPYEGGSPEAFLTAPRACTGQLFAGFRAESWEGATDAPPPVGVQGFEGCEELGFAPSISTSASAREAESPTGLDFNVEFAPDEGLTDPAGRANSDLRKIVAQLPAGVTLNPSAADGLKGCPASGYGAEALTSAPGAGCPQASKIGTVTATSPLVEEPLEGALFAAEPYRNPFGSLLGVYLVLRNQNLGVIVKQAGEVQADPVTGRLTATFAEAPQLPISEIQTHLRSGPRAPLATPAGCGDFSAQALESSWAGRQLTTTASLHIDSGPGGSPCPAGAGRLAPSFAAGVADNTAGSYSPLHVSLTRRDGEADITGLSVALPEGLTGRLAGVGRCPEAALAAAAARNGAEELASPSCPADSRIGAATAGAGIGPHLTWVHGSLYLAGPYRGVPLSVAAIVPAVAGPYDLGDVVVREPLRIDPATARVSVEGSADPLPRILKGVPVDLRELRISIDRPGFTLNPTSCSEKQIGATLAGVGPALPGAPSAPAALAVRYQASGCRALAFKPKLGLKLNGGRKQMKRSGHPQLTALLRPKSGQANLRRTTVLLPHSMFIDQFHVGNPCTRVQYNEGAGQGADCPKASILGTVKAWTPLLDNPLQGKVYFRANGGARELPDIVLNLNGQIHIEQVGFVDSKHERLRTRFTTVPDAPLSKVQIKFFGGKRGLLENSENLCAKKQVAHITMAAQNGRSRSSNVVIGTACKSKRTKRHAHHRRGG